AVRLDALLLLSPRQWRAASRLGRRIRLRAARRLCLRLGRAGRHGGADAGELDRRLRDDGSVRVSTADKPLRSDLARARGLGSAKEGVQHWWAQRLTALALVPLGLWFVASLIAHLGLDRAAAAAWLRQPGVVGLAALLIVAMFHHAQLGLQVVIEDYVGHEAVKLAAIILVKAVAILLATASLVALLTIAIGG